MTPVVDHLQEVPPFGLRQTKQHPVVHDEEVRSRELGQELRVALVAVAQGQGLEEPGRPVVPGGVLRPPAQAGRRPLCVHRVTSALGADAQATYEKLRCIASGEGTPALVVFSDSYNYPAFPWKGTINVFAGHAVFPKGAYFSRQTIVAMVCTRSEFRERGRGENYCITGDFESTAARYSFNRVEVGGRNTLYWKVFLPGLAPVN